MDAIGKSIALVWQLMLTIGIDYWALREALACVRTLTSDFGVERLLADIPDFLPDMFEFCGALPRNARDDYRRFLFPRCLSIAGWRHMCDGWIQRGCNSLRWFPKWIAELKNILSFLRSEPILEDLCRSLKARGMQGLADILRTTKKPSFAQWRWGKLRACCTSTGKYFASLREVFDPRGFRGMRDGARLARVCAAFADPLWPAKLRFLTWVSDWVGEIQEWIGGCDCPEHAALYAAHSPVACDRKGRRIKTAWRYATAALREGLATANDWTPADFGGVVWLCTGWIDITLFPAGVTQT